MMLVLVLALLAAACQPGDPSFTSHRSEARADGVPVMFRYETRIAPEGASLASAPIAGEVVAFRLSYFGAWADYHPGGESHVLTRDQVDSFLLDFASDEVAVEGRVAYLLPDGTPKEQDFTKSDAMVSIALTEVGYVFTWHVNLYDTHTTFSQAATVASDTVVISGDEPTDVVHVPGIVQVTVTEDARACAASLSSSHDAAVGSVAFTFFASGDPSACSGVVARLTGVPGAGDTSIELASGETYRLDTATLAPGVHAVSLSIHAAALADGTRPELASGTTTIDKRAPPTATSSWGLCLAGQELVGD